MSINQELREYFADVADVDQTGQSMHRCAMLALEELGYTGSLNTRLKSFWSDMGGTGNSLSTLMMTALDDSMTGVTVKSSNNLLRELIKYTTWDTIKTKWSREKRKTGRIG